MVKCGSGAVLERIGRLGLLLKADQNLTHSALARELSVSERTVFRYLTYMKSVLDLPTARALHDRRGDLFAPIQAGPADCSTERAKRAIAGAQPKDFIRPLMEQVHEGLCKRRKLLLRAPELRVDAFVFHPYFLSRMSGEVRLFGWLAGPGQLSDFPVSNLAEARCLPDTFEDDLATEPKIRHGRGWIPSGTRHEVCLRFPSPCGWVLGLKICSGQSVNVSEEHILIRFSTDDLGEVQRFAWALGTSVTVEEPGVLRSQLRRHLTEAGPVYSPLPHDFDRAPSSS